MERLEDVAMDVQNLQKITKNHFFADSKTIVFGQAKRRETKNHTFFLPELSRR